MTTITRDLLRRSWRSWYGSELAPVGPHWLQLVWTLLFCMALALPFTVVSVIGSRGSWLAPGRWLLFYGLNLVVTLSIGLLIHALFWSTIRSFGAARLRALPPLGRTAYFAGMPLLGALLGWPVGAWLVSLLRPGTWNPFANPSALAVSLLLAAIITMSLHFFFAAKAEQAQAERRATEAQLRLLQAQIEPHFLFNTLANVVALIDAEPAKAKQMLAAFTDYLRAGLTGLRRDAAALGDELALAEAYLRVQQARMEDRLRFAIDADEAARAALLPPLLLQPLVENAVQHGLEPALDGGTVTVRARADAGQLLIEVRDDGVGPGAGPRPAPGHGLALANIRQRLAQRYGDAAGLDLVAGEPGMLARLRLPLQTP